MFFFHDVLFARATRGRRPFVRPSSLARAKFPDTLSRLWPSTSWWRAPGYRFSLITRPKASAQTVLYEKYYIHTRHVCGVYGAVFFPFLFLNPSSYTPAIASGQYTYLLRTRHPVTHARFALPVGTQTWGWWRWEASCILTIFSVYPFIFQTIIFYFSIIYGFYRKELASRNNKQHVMFVFPCISGVRDYFIFLILLKTALAGYSRVKFGLWNVNFFKANLTTLIYLIRAPFLTRVHISPSVNVFGRGRNAEKPRNHCHLLG